MNNTISVIGGDSRQLYAAEYLKNKGYDVCTFATEHGKLTDGIEEAKSISDAGKSEIIILPLPVSKNGNMLNTPLSSEEIFLKDITDIINDNHVVFYGMGSVNFSRHIKGKARYSCDYFNIESLIYKNALLTAEGLISVLLEKLNVTIFGLKVAIIGYGRIGSLTADRIMSLGGEVSIFARDDMQRLTAGIRGAKVYSLGYLENITDSFDVIINTVPYKLINDGIIANSSKSCVFVEAASAPYGIDADACILHGRTLIKAFSLPGKTAPRSAGIIIGETIENILREVK